MLKRVLLSVLCVMVLSLGVAATVNSAEAATKKKSTISSTAKNKVAKKKSLATPAVASADYNSAKYADLIMDTGTGRILHETNADAERHPASLTKMMTLYLVFAALESGRLHLHDELLVSPSAAAAAPSKLGLRPGDRIEVEDVILGLVTRSANDAAITAGEALGGTEARFAGMMTQTAHKLGMSNTVYKNASGLPNDEQVTTARDQARLALAIQKHFPQYYPYFSHQVFYFRGERIESHNHLLARYEGMDGLKTGFINASGFNLVTSAKHGNTRLIGVIFGGTSAVSRDNQMARLLDAGFAGSFDNRPQVQMASAVVPAYKPEIAQPVIEKAAAASVPAASKSEVTSMDEEFAENASQGASQPANPEPMKQIAQRTIDQHAQAAQVAAAAPAVEAQPEAKRNPSPMLQAQAETAPAQPAQKATLRAPANDDAKTANRRNASEWGIQVGAYNDRASGQRATALVADSMPELLSKASAKVVTATSSSGTIYRARLIGIDEADARSACAQLQKKDRPCMVLPPAGGSTAWLASSN